MGNIIDSCASRIDCCDKYNLDKTDKNDNDELEEDEEFLEEDDHLDIIKRTTKNFLRFASDIKNMKVRANLLIQHKTDPWSLYQELQDLGFGTYGVVKKVCLKSNPDTIRAMKIIPKENLMEGYDNEKLLDEIIILKNLDHPNIMKLYEFFEDNTNCYMVSEYCDHGDLLQKMEKLSYMNEIVVKFLMEQILNAIAYLHSKGVIHGDIKLENIMLYTTTKKKPNQSFTRINKELTEDKKLQKEIEESFTLCSYNSHATIKSTQMVNNMANYEIKLIDFGCSKIFTKRGERKSGIIGTSIYCSPEVIDDLYDEKCDEWSCGVLMYVLLCGEPPFQGETEEEIFKKVKKCEYDFSPPQFDNVSKNCKDLIKKLLQPNKQKRIKAIDALKHPFFTESFNPETALKKNDNSIIEQLLNVKVPKSPFHRAIISYMSANYISKDEEKKLRTVFRYIDYDGKSFLTKAKIEKVLKEYGKECTPEKIQKILDALDVDKNGAIEYQEFIQGLCDKQSLFNDYNIKNIFIIMDNDNKGYLTSEDIKNFAFPNKTVDEEAITEYLKQFGMKIDDKLFPDEFKDIIQNNCSLDDQGDENKSENKENDDDDEEKEKKIMLDESIDLKSDKEAHKLEFENSGVYSVDKNSSLESSEIDNIEMK